MNVRFIDTSVMTNMLEIPGRCKDVKSVQEELKKVIEAKEVLILPIATIIERLYFLEQLENSDNRLKESGKWYQRIKYKRKLIKQQ